MPKSNNVPTLGSYEDLLQHARLMKAAGSDNQAAFHRFAVKQLKASPVDAMRAWRDA